MARAGPRGAPRRGARAAGRERAATPSGQITLGAVTANGLDGQAARQVVRRYLNQLRHCYARRLRDDPQLAGRVTLAVELDDRGSVTSTRATDSLLGDAAVEGCMLRSSYRWRFPAPTGGEATVTVPLTLAPD